MGVLYGVFAAFAIVNAFLVPWFLAKKYVIAKPYYAVAIAVVVILGAINVFMFANGKIAFIPVILYMFGPMISLFITDKIVEKMREQTGPKAIDFSTLYDPRAIFAKTKQMEEESCGFIRFRMDKVSYLTENFQIPAPELAVLSYARPLKDEAELLRLTNDFCNRYKDSLKDTNGAKRVEWKMADELWHDQEGAYRLLLVFRCDGYGRYPANYETFYLDYINKDTDPYQNRGFHSI